MTRSGTPHVWLTISCCRFSRLDAAHFGFRGKVCYHTGLALNRYIRLFRTNPYIADGVVVDSREGFIDVSFLIDERIRDDVQLSLEKQLVQIFDSKLL